MEINDSRLASGITIHYTKKRQYHFFLGKRPFYLGSWRYDRYIKINRKVFITDIEMHTEAKHPFNSRTFYLKFTLEIDRRPIYYYRCYLDTDKYSGNFGYWRVYKEPAKMKSSDMDILTENKAAIIRWYENMRRIE